MKRSLCCLLVLWACSQISCAQPQPPPETKLAVIASHPHDTEAFTQGLFFHGGFLYESTGLYGRSTLRKVDIVTGRVVRQIAIPETFFAEGIDRIGDRIVMLTWKEKKGFFFDLESFEKCGEFSFSGEGWGICFDGKRLICSNGSAVLRFLDPETFKETGRISVFDGPSSRKGRAITKLNELEYVRGEIWANVWGENRIVRINPADGQVCGWIDLVSLVPRELLNEKQRRGENVLNGIAFDPARNRLYITGKNWPVLYELSIEP